MIGEQSYGAPEADSDEIRASPARQIATAALIVSAFSGLTPRIGGFPGLGRFGVHHMMITPVGCTGCLGSLVSEAELGDHPLIETQEACLFKAGKEGGQCIKVCPVEALSEEGFARRHCWDRLTENRRTLDCFADLPESTHGCAKCAAWMPCSFKNPVANLDRGNSN